MDEENVIKTPGGNKVWCKDGIIHYLISAPVDESEAVQLRDEGRKFVDAGEAHLVSIDIQQSTQFSSAARRIWVEFLKHPKIFRATIFGGNVFVRTLASFVIAASSRGNMKFFATEKEALKWLHVSVDQNIST